MHTGGMDMRRWTGLVVAAVSVVACSEGSDDADPIVSASEAEQETVDGDVFTEVDSGVTSADQPPEAEEPVVESIPPVPETGVPGLDSEDAFCRAWSEYAGSVQALSLAWAVQPPDEAAALEVAASDAVTGAVAAMSADLPAEIESNRQALTVDVPGPFLRRAERARIALVGAGASEDDIGVLGDAWLEALAASGVDAEDVTLDLASELRAVVDDAAADFRAEVPSIVEDPTLDTTEFDIGPSLDYIFESCPDRGTLAGNDVIDG